MRILIMTMWVSLAITVAGCVAPSPQNADAQATAAGQPTHADRNVPIAASPKPAQPVTLPSSDPQRAQAPVGAPVQVNRSCQVDGDCVVKDVGSCCGYFPACVHKNSPTDPAGVRAQCAKSDMASVCGFNEITACRCVRNQCVGEQEPVGGWMDDPPAPPPANR